MKETKSLHTNKDFHLFFKLYYRSLQNTLKDYGVGGGKHTRNKGLNGGSGEGTRTKRFRPSGAWTDGSRVSGTVGVRASGKEGPQDGVVFPARTGPPFFLFRLILPVMPMPPPHNPSLSNFLSTGDTDLKRSLRFQGNLD